MNNKEIDRLVAEKVMGWEVIEYKNIGKTVIDDGEFPVEIEEFKPTELIEDAWTVVEKLQGMKYRVQISTHGGTYEVECARYEDACYFSQEEKTVQLAICKIALEVAGFEVEE
ncbi:BC1872 family protein [Paraliobacillus ryukyuensis]|uniref:BC1872 family protein n=1 Tax=Paraliobacillus ryukyuensis TaxID=200904 RepID=UPI0009A6F9BE|nr:hypothetical protein [Paraliobacillus ryukyuensis]